MCKYLIEDGKSASINKADIDGRTPLKIATDGNHTAVIAYLESKGATYSGMSKEEEASNLSHPPFAYNAISGLRIIRRTPLFASLSSLTK